MPTVPTYDDLRVSTGALPNARASISAPQVAPGAQAREFGRDVSNLGGALGQIAGDMQARVNESRVSDAMNQLVKRRLEAQAEAMSLKGKNALERPSGESLMDDYDKVVGSFADELAGSLGNDYQRNAFGQQARQLRMQLRSSLMGHVVAQQQEYEKETDLAGLSVAQQQGGLFWGDVKMRDQALGAARAIVMRRATADGVASDPLIVDARMAEAMSPIHAAVIQGMVDSDRADLAEAYYADNSATMSLQVRATASRLINAGAQDQKVRVKIDEVMAATGGNYTEAVKLLRADKDASIAKLAEDELYQRETQDRIVRDQAENEALGTVQKAIEDGASWGTIRKMPAFLALSDGMEAKANSYYDTRQREIRAELRAIRAEREGKEQETNLEDYNTLSNLAAAGKLKDADLSKYRLSRSDLRRFIDVRAQQRNPDAKTGERNTATFADGEVSAFKSQLPNDKVRGAFEMAAAGELQARIAAGEKNTPEMRRRILEDLSLKREGQGLFSSDRYGFDLTPSERRARDLVVPEVDRRMIEEALRAKGKPVTDAAVQRLYRQAKGF